MVVFVNGASDRAEYRKFKLRNQKNDDTKNLREVVERRLKHEEWTLPNLVILDGGEGQINAVKDLLDAKNIPVIGRNKSGDHTRNAAVSIVLPDASIYELNKDSHVAKLIARIDEESHRFAITYHRLLRRKNMLK
jgi:excinuclease ABC subunit C